MISQFKSEANAAAPPERLNQTSHLLLGIGAVAMGLYGFKKTYEVGTMLRDALVGLGTHSRHNGDALSEVRQQQR